jgi:hypothetical protein
VRLGKPVAGAAVDLLHSDRNTLTFLGETSIDTDDNQASRCEASSGNRLKGRRRSPVF